MHKSFTKTAFAGKHYVFLPSCPSTNDLASSLLKAGQAWEGTVVRSGTQTAGKGQRGNTWESEPGQNLLFSLVLSPRFLSVTDQFQLTLISSLGIYDALSHYIPEGLRIKWPNDIYWQDRKIGGILIENSLRGQSIEHSVIGIGLNVNQRSFPVPSASSVALITGSNLPLDALHEEILLHIEKYYLRIRSGQSETLRHLFEERLYRRNEPASYHDGDTFEGIIRGVDASGLLQVEKEGTIQRYDLKEISYR